jgi:hypothetical protein
MAGIAATIRADDHARLAGEGVSYLALAFVSPLSSENDCCWHPFPV